MILSIPVAAFAAEQPVLEEQVRGIAAGLRCVVCQNLSVADSPSEMAQQMRGIIREQLQEGKSPEEINAYFVSKYGEWVLLAPSPKGFSLMLWVLPFIALIAGIVFVIFVARRWVRKKEKSQATLVDRSLMERVREEIAEGKSPEVEEEAEGAQAMLLREQARLYADLRELDFDFQAGKLSEADYQYLRRELESQAAATLKQLESSPSRSKAAARKERPQAEKKPPEAAKGSHHGWKIALGGAFLLIFGITLGVFLTQSLRPRTSEQDSITGDFLTGTNSAAPTSGMGISQLLSQGRTAFEKRDWPTAIESFKAALEIDPNRAEAHAYMGLILAQAGHAEGALLAFNRSLESDPNFPLALWGKGMILYQAKEDFPAAREVFEKLAAVMPPGPEKDQVQETLAELARLNPEQKAQAKAPAPPASGAIEGTVTVAPALADKIDNQAVLFVIVHSAGSTGGPPLAVKKISRPVFPLTYSIGSEDVMMQGTPLAGKVTVSVRLDKDGNAMTRDEGDLIGEYKKNPVEIGSQKVDIVIDQMM